MTLMEFLTWPTRKLTDLTRRIPGMQRFDDWANEKEREWRRRRNAPLVRALADVGLVDQANRLNESTAGQ